MPNHFAIDASAGQPAPAQKALHEVHLATQATAAELRGHMELAAAAFSAKQI